MKCLFHIDDESLEEAFEWFHSVGISWIKTSEELCEYGSVDVELKHTPSILEFFSQLGELSICKITSQGISFYVTNIPLGSCTFLLVLFKKVWSQLSLVIVLMESFFAL